MQKEYRTVKSSNHVGTVSREAVATAVRDLNAEKQRTRTAKSSTGRFSIKKSGHLSSYALKKR